MKESLSVSFTPSLSFTIHSQVFELPQGDSLPRSSFLYFFLPLCGDEGRRYLGLRWTDSVYLCVCERERERAKDMSPRGNNPTFNMVSLFALYRLFRGETDYTLAFHLHLVTVAAVCARVCLAHPQRPVPQ